jgi:hypothetical protein
MGEAADDELRGAELHEQAEWERERKRIIEGEEQDVGSIRGNGCLVLGPAFVERITRIAEAKSPYLPGINMVDVMQIYGALEGQSIMTTDIVALLSKVMALAEFLELEEPPWFTAFSVPFALFDVKKYLFR